MDIHVSNAVITTVPALNTTVILWDSTADYGTGTTLTQRRAYTYIRRAIVRIYADQIVTLRAKDLVVGSTTWRVVNGGGSGEATSVNTYFERDYLFASDDHMLDVVVTTAPTVWEVSVRLVEDERALGQ